MLSLGRIRCQILLPLSSCIHFQVLLINFSTSLGRVYFNTEGGFADIITFVWLTIIATYMQQINTSSWEVPNTLQFNCLRHTRTCI